MKKIDVMKLRVLFRNEFWKIEVFEPAYNVAQIYTKDDKSDRGTVPINEVEFYLFEEDQV